MLTHSTHLLFGGLWLLAVVHAAREHPVRGAELVVAVLDGLVYVTGLGWFRRRLPAARQRQVGAVWLMALLGLWGLLCTMSSAWLLLFYPLCFLVFFILPSPACWVLDALVAGWAVVSAILRPGRVSAEEIAGPLIGFLVAAISWVVLQQLRADVQEQQRLNQELALAQQQLLESAAARARDQEREQIGRDLHDTLAQGLNSIVMLSRAAQTRHPDAGEELGVIEATARDNLAHARALMRGLTTPTGLLDEQLREIVAAQQAREHTIGSGTLLGFDQDGQPRPVPAAVQHAAAMATRSLLANVVQHAHAARCLVSLTWHPDQIGLDVVDDGTGIGDPTPGFGLRALEQRVAALHGTLEITSNPGEGTSVAITLPVPDEAASVPDGAPAPIVTMGAAAPVAAPEPQEENP